MTVIVGLEQDGYVTVGGDAANVNVQALLSNTRADTKVFTNGPFIIGISGSFRMGQLLRFTATFSPPPDPADVDAMDKYMVTDFVNQVRTAYKTGGWSYHEGGREEGGRFLVAYGPLLYQVQADFHICRTAEGYQAIGLGAELALGALYATRNIGLSAENRVGLAMESANHFSGAVRPPYTIMTTRPGE